MSWLNNHTGSARAIAVVALGGPGLSACATSQCVDERIAMMNSRIDQTDARVTTAAQRAEAASLAAKAAATDARTANQRIDQLGGRVDTMERGPTRTPRTARRRSAASSDPPRWTPRTTASPTAASTSGRLSKARS